MSEATISLGGREFAIEPLKLGQPRALLDAAARVIQAGLARSMPDLTLDRVLELEATMDEVTAAVTVVLSVAGLNRREADAPGEAAPVATTQPRTAAAHG